MTSKENITRSIGFGSVVGNGALNISLIWRSAKGFAVSFDDVLDHLYATLGRYEPSFSSKLVATLDPNQPVWDKFVLKNTGQTEPSYKDKNKIPRAKQVFQNIQDWYSEFMKSDDSQLIIATFNRLVEDHEKLTNIKKIDFVLWQTRT